MDTESRKNLAYSIADVVDRVPLGRTFVYESIRRGELTARKAGRRTIILPRDLETWLSALPSRKTGGEGQDV